MKHGQSKSFLASFARCHNSVISSPGPWHWIIIVQFLAPTPDWLSHPDTRPGPGAWKVSGAGARVVARVASPETGVETQSRSRHRLNNEWSHPTSASDKIRLNLPCCRVIVLGWVPKTPKWHDRLMYFLYVSILNDANFIKQGLFPEKSTSKINYPRRP